MKNNSSSVVGMASGAPFQQREVVSEPGAVLRWDRGLREEGHLRCWGRRPGDLERTVIQKTSSGGSPGDSGSDTPSSLTAEGLG